MFVYYIYLSTTHVCQQHMFVYYTWLYTTTTHWDCIQTMGEYRQTRGTTERHVWTTEGKGETTDTEDGGIEVLLWGIVMLGVLLSVSWIGVWEHMGSFPQPQHFLFHRFQKYKDELWGPLGIACPRGVNFGPKWGKNTKEMATIPESIFIWL